MDCRADAYWNQFLQEKGLGQDIAYIECFHFDLTAHWANALLQLVLEGKKRATASSLHYFGNNNLPLPKAGDYSIVTDWAGTPHCVIRTTKVTILPFQNVTWELCKKEGEDESLESWQRGHMHFFTEDGKAEGYEFTPEMPVVFEEFELVYNDPIKE